MSERDQTALAWLAPRAYWTLTRSREIYMLDLDGVEFVGASLTECVEKARSAVRGPEGAAQ